MSGNCSHGSGRQVTTVQDLSVLQGGKVTTHSCTQTIIIDYNYLLNGSLAGWSFSVLKDIFNCDKVMATLIGPLSMETEVSLRVSEHTGGIPEKFPLDTQVLSGDPMSMNTSSQL